VSSFRNTRPYHRNLFCCSTEITSSFVKISETVASHATDPNSFERRQSLVADVLNDVVQRLGKQHRASVKRVLDRLEQLDQATHRQNGRLRHRLLKRHVEVQRRRHELPD